MLGIGPGRGRGCWVLRLVGEVGVGCWAAAPTPTRGPHTCAVVNHPVVVLDFVVGGAVNVLLADGDQAEPADHVALGLSTNLLPWDLPLCDSKDVKRECECSWCITKYWLRTVQIYTR